MADMKGPKTSKAAAKTSAAKKPVLVKSKKIDTPISDAVTSEVKGETVTTGEVATADQTPTASAVLAEATLADATTKDQIMTDVQTQTPDASNETPLPVLLKRSDKDRSTQMVVFTIADRPGSVRFSKTLFAGGEAPETITFPAGVFGPRRVPRSAETAEQRKARLAALPKLTLAEKADRLEKKLAKMREKLTKSAAPAEQAAQPEAVGV